MTIRLGAVLLRGDLGLAVGDAIDRAVPVVGDQQRAVLQLHHVDRPADIIVVLQEAGHERLDRTSPCRPCSASRRDVAAELLGPVPRAVPRHEDRILVGLREHVAGVEPHAQRRGMRAQQTDRRR